MNTLVLEKDYTAQEYLERGERADRKHEFHRGKIVPVSGVSFIHNTIAVNILTALKIAIRTKRSNHYVTNSDTKIWIDAAERFVYPDAVLVLKRPIYYKGRTDIITNPLLVVEILSPGTQKKDRTAKFDDYRTLPTLQEYVLVDQDQPQVSVFNRSANWQETVVQGGTHSLQLASADITLALADIYEGIDELRR